MPNISDIALQHNISLTIGDESFSVAVRLATGKDKQVFKALVKSEQKKAATSDKKRKAYEKNQKKLNAARAELRDNQDLYSLEDERDIKKELLGERKLLRVEIEKLELTIEEYETPDYTQMLKGFDAVPKKQFAVLVSGDDKERLESFLEEYEVSYSDLWAIINQKIAKSKEKK